MITPVFYQKVEEEIAKASSYYFMANMVGIDSELDERFVEHETETIKLRNQVLGYAIIAGECPDNVKLDTAILAISPMRNETVIIAEY